MLECLLPVCQLMLALLERLLDMRRELPDRHGLQHLRHTSDGHVVCRGARPGRAELCLLGRCNASSDRGLPQPSC